MYLLQSRLIRTDSACIQLEVRGVGFCVGPRGRVPAERFLRGCPAAFRTHGSCVKVVGVPGGRRKAGERVGGGRGRLFRAIHGPRKGVP